MRSFGNRLSILILTASGALGFALAAPQTTRMSTEFTQLQAQFLNVDTNYDTYTGLLAIRGSSMAFKQKRAAASYVRSVKSLHHSLAGVDRLAGGPVERRIMTRLKKDVAIYEKSANAMIARVKRAQTKPPAGPVLDPSIDTHAISSDFDALESAIVKTVPRAAAPPAQASAPPWQLIGLVGALLLVAAGAVLVFLKLRKSSPATMAPSPLLHFLDDLPPPSPVSVESAPFAARPPKIDVLLADAAEPVAAPVVEAAKPDVPIFDAPPAAAPPVESAIDEFHVQIVEQLQRQSQELSARLTALHESAEATIALAQTVAEHNPETANDPEFAAMIDHSHTLAAEMLVMVKSLRRSSNSIQYQVMRMLSVAERGTPETVSPVEPAQ